MRTWQADEGLPDDRVEAIAQTHDGYLWVGTGGGVAKFDGVQFIPLDLQAVLGTRNAYITSLAVGLDGALWIGADGAGLVRLQNNSLSLFTAANGLAGNRVMALQVSHDGTLWIGTTTGVSHYLQGKFANYTKQDGLRSDIVRDIHEDRAGNLWIATGDGLNCLTGRVMRGYCQTNGLPVDSLRRIYEDGNGSLWIGSNNGLILHSNQAFYAYSANCGLAGDFVSALGEDEDGNFWAGTYDGLTRLKQGQFVSEQNNDGLPFGRINALFKDREGTLWVGAQEGLSRLTPQRFSSFTVRQGLAHDNVISVLEDHTGALWMATWGGGLNELQSGKITTYTAATNRLVNNLCLSLCEGGDGSLWIGEDYNGGLTQLKNGRFRRYTSRDGLFNAAIRVIHEDRSGDLWVGTSQGLSRLSNGNFTNYTTQDHLAGNAIRALCEAPSGDLWIGTDAGLSCWRNGRFINYTTTNGLNDNFIMALYEDQATNLWIGTAHGGLNRFKDGRFTACTTRQGLFSDSVYAILDDDHGWLWMSCSKGVFRVQKRDLDKLDRGQSRNVASIAYGKADGLESTLCSGVAQPAGWKSRDGRLWFCTSKGVVSFNPDQVKINPTPPPVYIEQLIADKNPLATRSQLSSTAAETPVKISPGRGELEFHYTALDYQKPEKIRFRYQLLGVDPDWTEADTRRAAYYNNLSPGTYLFRVAACNSDGVWGQTSASLAVVVLPHVWQTWWFRTLVVLVGAAGGMASVRWLAGKKLRQELARLEQQKTVERERSRIAQDMHDDLGARLSEILLNSHWAANNNISPEQIRSFAGKMTTLAGELMNSLDAIVWSVNPKNDSLDHFSNYICEYFQSYMEMASLKYSLDVPGQMPDCPLSSEIRHHLYLVIKEALHNVVKHACATHVRFHLQVVGSTLAASIEDNGRGFSRAAAGGMGNGLENMEARIHSMGGRFELAALPHGTRVSFQIPLLNQARSGRKPITVVEHHDN